MVLATDNTLSLFVQACEQDVRGKFVYLVCSCHFLFIICSNSFILPGGNVSVDGTFKVTSHGFPLLMIGTTDLNQTFKVVAIALSSHEDEVALHSFFKAVQNACVKCCGVSPIPKFGMSDHASAARNAATQIWPAIIWLDCFAHISAINLNKKGASTCYACHAC